jgi:hypothetical protein
VVLIKMKKVEKEKELRNKKIGIEVDVPLKKEW